MPLHITAYSEGFTANHARMGLFTSVYTSMILQVAARPERLVAVLAAVILLASVDTPVHDQRVFTCERLGAILALVLLVFRVNTRRVILQIAPLPEMSSTFLAFVRLVTAVKSLVYLWQR